MKERKNIIENLTITQQTKPDINNYWLVYCRFYWYFILNMGDVALN